MKWSSGDRYAAVTGYSATSYWMTDGTRHRACPNLNKALDRQLDLINLYELASEMGCLPTYTLISELV